jgi:ATPase subunit of ABC transporter with duplicated ATPase domains
LGCRFAHVTAIKNLRFEIPLISSLPQINPILNTKNNRARSSGARSPREPGCRRADRSTDMIHRIAITGPESSGKTTLAKAPAKMTAIRLSPHVAEISAVVK